MKTAVVVGNPKPKSRTLEAGVGLARLRHVSKIEHRADLGRKVLRGGLGDLIDHWSAPVVYSARLR